MATAEVSRIDSRAVITDGNKVYAFDLSENPPLKEVGQSFHGGMFLQPAMAKQQGEPIECWDAGEYPFVDFQAQMLLYRRKRAALGYFLNSLDADLAPEQRKYRAGRAEECINADPLVAEEVERILLGQPLADEWDVTEGPKNGRAGEIMQKIIARWRS